MQKIIDFFISVRVELEKVVWPGKDLTIRLTVIVIFVTLIVGFFIGGVDYLLTKLLGTILNK